MPLSDITKGVSVYNCPNDLVKLTEPLIKVCKKYPLVNSGLIAHMANSTPYTLLGNILTLTAKPELRIIIMFNMFMGAHNRIYLSLDYLQECLRHVRSVVFDKPNVYVENTVLSDMVDAGMREIYRSIVTYNIPNVLFREA